MYPLDEWTDGEADGLVCRCQDEQTLQDEYSTLYD